MMVVLSWMSELRIKTEIMSAAPSNARKPSERMKLRERPKATVIAP